MIYELVPIEYQKLFRFFLERGEYKYNAHALMDQLGRTDFHKLLIHGLKPYLNKHPELGYKITGSGPYQPKGEKTIQPSAWIEFKRI